MGRSFVSRGLLTAALASAFALGGCETAATYHPATGHGFDRSGYSDRQIEANRFQVTFSGNGYTPRDTVEKYLLYRAAELTIQNGDDYFIMVNRDTDKQNRTYVNQPFGPGPWGGWGPSWRFYGRGWGYHRWDPFWGDPFWADDVDVQTIQRYEATAEIIVGKGPKPANNVRAFDAHEVISHIGPTVVMPKQ
jgi:hypothetical protein